MLKQHIDSSRNKFKETISKNGNSKALYKFIRFSLASKISTLLHQHHDVTLCPSNEERSELLSLTFSQAFISEPHNDTFPQRICPRIDAPIENIYFTPQLIKTSIKTPLQYIPRT